MFLFKSGVNVRIIIGVADVMWYVWVAEVVNLLSEYMCHVENMKKVHW